MANQFKRPQGMPHQPPKPGRQALHGQPVQAAPMPQQQKLTDEEIVEKQPSKLARLIRRVGMLVLLALALVFAYIFLLLGEPDEDAKYVKKPMEESIAVPMSALDIPGESNADYLAETFGQPVLSLGQALPMYKSRIYDTAFEGGYARRVTLTYTLEDGQQLTAESIRPTSAVTLLKQDGYKLDGSTLYTLGGLNAARMDNDSACCIFAQTDTAVYAVIAPLNCAEELPSLLRYTMLVAPETGD